MPRMLTRNISIKRSSSTQNMWRAHSANNICSISGSSSSLKSALGSMSGGNNKKSQSHHVATNAFINSSSPTGNDPALLTPSTCSSNEELENNHRSAISNRENAPGSFLGYGQPAVAPDEWGQFVEVTDEEPGSNYSSLVQRRGRFLVSTTRRSRVKRSQNY